MYIEDCGIQSKADFKKLMEECFKLVNSYFAVSKIDYPNIHQLADEYKTTIEALDFKSWSFVFGKQQKINFIKHIRSVTNLSLLDAKLIAEGHFRRNGWE